MRTVYKEKKLIAGVLKDALLKCLTQNNLYFYFVCIFCSSSGNWLFYDFKIDLVTFNIICNSQFFKIVNLFGSKFSKKTAWKDSILL